MVTQSAKLVMPMITVGSVEDVRTFYTERLGFTHLMGVVGEDGRLDSATVGLDGARIMFTQPRVTTDEAQPAAALRPVDIYLEVADVDAFHAQLTERNVPISDPLTLQWWGDRTFKVVDPSGYEVWFYQKVGAPRPPEGMKIV